VVAAYRGEERMEERDMTPMGVATVLVDNGFVRAVDKELVALQISRVRLCEACANRPLAAHSSGIFVVADPEER
jgi:alkylhydroperoxidase family enzyme